MELVIIIIISIGLSADCFGIAVINGMAPEALRPGTKLKVSLSFALAHFIMIFAGFHLGKAVGPAINAPDHWVGFMILSLIGFKMFISNLRASPLTKAFDTNNIKVVIWLSVATSINALIAGVSLPFMGCTIVLTSLVVAITVFALTFTGIHYGRLLGFTLGKRAGAIGGVIIMGIGLANLLYFLIF